MKQGSQASCLLAAGLLGGGLKFSAKPPLQRQAHRVGDPSCADTIPTAAGSCGGRFSPPGLCSSGGIRDASRRSLMRLKARHSCQR